jgi:undecaprenyl diphosphate synthase
MSKTLPTCIGFIMDGNRRFATEAGMDVATGHKAGAEVFESVVEWLSEVSVPHGVFYAFSTENWNRHEDEVAALLSLIEMTLEKQRTVRLRFIGERGRFSDELQEKLANAEARHNNAAHITVWVALSYGGRSEIVAAVNDAIEKGIPVTETTFRDYFLSRSMPDPDLIIRTGGEQRLSNFLPWQSVYSELMFTSTYWPAFTKDEFMSMLAQYGDRKRRFGR